MRGRLGRLLTSTLHRMSGSPIVRDKALNTAGVLVDALEKGLPAGRARFALSRLSGSSSSPRRGESFPTRGTGGDRPVMDVRRKLVSSGLVDSCASAQYFSDHSAFKRAGRSRVYRGSARARL